MWWEARPLLGSEILRPHSLWVCFMAYPWISNRKEFWTRLLMRSIEILIWSKSVISLFENVHSSIFKILEATLKCSDRFWTLIILNKEKLSSIMIKWFLSFLKICKEIILCKFNLIYILNFYKFDWGMSMQNRTVTLNKFIWWWRK